MTPIPLPEPPPRDPKLVNFLTSVIEATLLPSADNVQLIKSLYEQMRRAGLIEEIPEFTRAFSGSPHQLDDIIKAHQIARRLLMDRE